MSPIPLLTKYENSYFNEIIVNSDRLIAWKTSGDRLSYNNPQSGEDNSIIPTPQTYRDKLKPWCVIRHLPNLQRLTVARFTRRNDADAYHQALRRLMPNLKHAVIFDVPVTLTKQ